MAKKTKTSARIADFREVFGGLGTLASFTHISPQRLQAIAENKPKTRGVTRSEAGRIAAFSRRQELGVVSYDLEAAARKRGVTIGQLGAELRDATQGRLTAGKRVGIPEIAHALGVDPEAVRRLSVDPGLKRNRNGSTRERRASRQITEAVITPDGHVVAYGGDGNKYVGYTVRNTKTGEKRFFWGRFESIGYLAGAELAEKYDQGDLAFEIDLDVNWG